MKKLATFVIAMFLLLMTNVKAASNCSYQEQTELNSKAANIKASYEIIEEVYGEETVLEINYFRISISNVLEEFYVVVENSTSNEKDTYYFSDAKDGFITFDWKNLEEVTNFTIQIYTSSSTSCSNEKIKTLYLTTPRYNYESSRAICLDNPDFYLCKKFVTFDEIESDEFMVQIEKYFNGDIDDDGEELEDPKESTNKIFEFIKEYKWFIIGGFLLIIVIVLVIRRFKTKKQRELGL